MILSDCQIAHDCVHKRVLVCTHGQCCQACWEERCPENGRAAISEAQQRIATIADEAFGPFPVQTCDENLTAIERGIFGLRQRIGRLEAEREAVADVASEGDVEDLLDALDNLAADPKDGETWGMRYQTASALHDAWQEERQRRGQAEQDAERWHRLFDEGATLTERLQADNERLVEAAKALANYLRDNDLDDHTGKYWRRYEALRAALGGGQ